MRDRLARPWSLGLGSLLLFLLGSPAGAVPQ